MTRPTRAVAHVAAVAILLMVLALPLYSRDALAAGTAQVRTILVNAIVSQTAIYGHSIVWTQSVPPSHGNLVPESLYWSDLAQVIPHRIFTFPSGTTALNLRVSADWIAADLSGTRGSSIWVFRHCKVSPFQTTASLLWFWCPRNTSAREHFRYTFSISQMAPSARSFPGK